MLLNDFDVDVDVDVSLSSASAFVCSSLSDVCAIQRLALTVSDVCLRLICSQSTSTYSALDFDTLCAIQIYDLLTLHRQHLSIYCK